MFHYDEEQELYLTVIDGVEFASEEEPDSEDEARELAKSYQENLPRILEFLLPELEGIYGEIDREKLTELLGQPRIDLDTFQVLYLGHSLDDVHIISFEFGENFEAMENFSLDG